MYKSYPAVYDVSMNETASTVLISRAMQLAGKLNEHGSLTHAEFSRLNRLARVLHVRSEDLVEAAA